jgi:hypothetical protein
MQTGAGTLALIAGGVIIVAVGGYHVYKGASRNFLDDLKGKSSDLVRRLGMVGYIAKGLAIESPWFRWRLGLSDFDQGLVGPFRSVEDGFELCGR